jgi:predicted esterase
MRPELPPNAFVGIVTDPASVPTAQAAAMDAMHDMQAAVRWSRANADVLGIDPDRIVATGMSAGAIMALMVAFNEDDPGTSGTPGESSAVAAAISHAGAYVPVLQGAFPAPGAPPIAIYHGTHDEQVPYPTSPPACVLTVLMGNTCEYTTYVGREHAVLGADLAADFAYRYVIEPTRDPYVAVTHADADADGFTLRGGTEHLTEDLGLVEGIHVPDLEVVLDRTVDLVAYVLEALGLG